MAGRRTDETGALPGRRERRKRATRAELVLAGRRLFSEKGLYEAKIEELTRHAGIAKGTLYGYFADKDDLARAVVAEGFAALGAQVAARTRRARGLDDAVRGLVSAHIAFFEANPDLMRVFHQVRGMLKFDRAEWRPLRTTLASFLDGLAGTLGRTPEGAALSPSLRRALAELLFGSISGAVSGQAARRPGAALVPARGRLVEALVALARTYVSEETGLGRRRGPRARQGWGAA